MNNTRIGKIARLPKAVREVLGDRLEAGVKASVLAAWLNGLECVQKVLQEYFGSRLINEQNLTEWRQGGHQDWLRGERARLLADRLAEEAEDLPGGRGPLGDRLASRMAVEMARLAEILVEQEADPRKRWEQLCQVNRELARLRREDHRAAQMELNRQRLEFEVARANGHRYDLPRPGDGDFRIGPSSSQSSLNRLERLTQESNARTLPEYRKPFVPVREQEENIKTQNPNFKEDSNSEVQRDAVGGRNGVAESDQKRSNQSKSNLSNSVEEGDANSKIQDPNSKEAPNSKAQMGAADGQNGPAESGQIQLNPTESDLSASPDGQQPVAGEMGAGQGNYGKHGTNGTGNLKNRNPS